MQDKKNRETRRETKKIGRRDARRKNMGGRNQDKKKWGDKMQDKKMGRQDARQKKNGVTGWETKKKWGDESRDKNKMGRQDQY